MIIIVLIPPDISHKKLPIMRLKDFIHIIDSISNT